MFLQYIFIIKQVFLFFFDAHTLIYEGCDMEIYPIKDGDVFFNKESIDQVLYIQRVVFKIQKNLLLFLV
jgi:hypothetical protein